MLPIRERAVDPGYREVQPQGSIGRVISYIVKNPIKSLCFTTSASAMVATAWVGPPTNTYTTVISFVFLLATACIVACETPQALAQNRV